MDSRTVLKLISVPFFFFFNYKSFTGKRVKILYGTKLYLSAYIILAETDICSSGRGVEGGGVQNEK